MNYELSKGVYGNVVFMPRGMRIHLIDSDVFFT